MLLLILMLGLILFVVGVIIFDDLGEFLMTLGGFASIVVGFILLILIVIYPYKVDEKITMYEEENAKIETKVKDTVRVYMDYEQETYENLVKDADLTTLLIKYPELNSNELIKTEVELYIKNNESIKGLKEAKIMRSTYRWWLYFGN